MTIFLSSQLHTDAILLDLHFVGNPRRNVVDPTEMAVRVLAADARRIAGTSGLEPGL